MAVGSTWKMLAVLARRGPAHFFEGGREVGTQDAQKRDKIHTAPWTHHTLKSQDRYEGCRRLPLNASAPLELEKGKGTLRDAVCPRRRTEGVKPGTMKAASPVVNGGDEATSFVRPRLVAPQ